MNVIPLVKKRDWHYFDQQLAELNSKDVETVIARGRVLLEMKEELAHGSFEATVKRHMSTTAAKYLMAIARHAILSNRHHGDVLPASWRTLYELTKLPDETLIAKLKDGTINPKTERSDVIAIQNQSNPKREKVVAAIKANPTANQRNAAKELDVSLGMYQHTRRKMIADGDIEDTKAGHGAKTKEQAQAPNKAPPAAQKEAVDNSQSTGVQKRAAYVAYIHSLPEDEQVEEVRIFFRRELKWTVHEINKFMGVMKFKL